MNQLNELLTNLAEIKESISSHEETTKILKDTESQLKREITGYMIDNEIEKKTSPDGKYVATLTNRKSVTIADKKGLLSYVLVNREDLLSVDLPKTKAEMKNDKDLQQFFDIEQKQSISFSEIKETVVDIENPTQFRDRVRKEQEGK